MLNINGRVVHKYLGIGRILEIYGRVRGMSYGSPPSFDPKKDYYQILGVNKSSTEKEIKTAYYKLAQKYHPDKNNGKTVERFKSITNAYDVIGDSSKRREYDNYRDLGTNFHGQSNSSPWADDYATRRKTNYNYSYRKDSQGQEEYYKDGNHTTRENFEKNFREFWGTNYGNSNYKNSKNYYGDQNNYDFGDFMKHKDYRNRTNPNYKKPNQADFEDMFRRFRTDMTGSGAYKDVNNK